jgi:DNA primase
MAGRSREVTDEIRRRINILDVVSAHVTLKRAGRRYTGLCPFHSEKTPSFTVNPELGFFYCFGCHAGGDVFDFVMRMSGVGFPDALAELAGRAGVRLERSPEEERSGGERERLLRTVAEAAAFFRGQLAAPEGRAARRYLAERGVTGAAVEAFKLGYAPAGWDGLLRALRSRGFDGPALELAGLAVARSGGDGYYDALRHRLIFPIHDLQGRPVAFGGRALDDATPKYLNTRETALFVKGRALYALEAARGAIRESGEAVVIEGYMDALACHQFGVTNAVASLGTALTLDQALLLKRFASRAVLVYDADAAGMDAAERGLGIFEQAELPVRVAVLPGGADPDEFLRDKGTEAFRRILEEGRPVFEYRLAMASRRHDARTVEGKVGIVDEMSQLIIIAPNPVRQSEYVRLLAERLGVREDAVRGQIRRLAKGRDQAGAAANATAVRPDEQLRRGAASRRTAPETDGRMGAERLLLHLLVADASLRPVVRKSSTGGTAFREPAHHALADALLDPEAEDVDPRRLRERLRDEGAISLLSRFLIEEPPVRGDIRRVAEGCLRTMRLFDVGERINRLAAAHAEAVRSRDDQRRDELAAELLEARREKERIRELKVSV